MWYRVLCRAEPEMEGLLCDLLWADPSDDPGVTNIESLSDQVRCLCVMMIMLPLMTRTCSSVWFDAVEAVASIMYSSISEA